MNILIGFIGVIGFILPAVYFYYRNKYNYWLKRNINGPKPFWFIGNYHQLVFTSCRRELELKWYKEFGKIYGFYRGTDPQLVISDNELIQQITVKDFDLFTDHENLNYFNKYQKSFIFFAQGDRWKRIRVLMSPTFTSAKIKRMFKFLDECANDLVESFNEQLKSNSIINVQDLYYLYTIDAIASCCYGIKLQRDSKVKDIKNAFSRNDFVKFVTKAFSLSTIRFIIGAIMPSIILKKFNFLLTKEENMKPMAHYVEKLIANRRKMPEKKFDDYLQLLIDARLDDKMELDELDSKENHHVNLANNSSLLNYQKKMIDDLKVENQNSFDDKQQTKEKTLPSKNMSFLSDLEIISGAMFLLFVGLDTTGVLLTQCTYTLAFHQDVQKRLYHELCKIVKNESSFDYEELTSCLYLDSVIAETLRLLPPFPVTNRVAREDYYIEKYNLKITKGTVVHLNNYILMNSTEHWIEPLKFDPERFMPGQRENIKPGTYCPFGSGPRHCVGMRFSLTESKLALAKLIMNFEFHPVDGYKFPAETGLSPFMIKPKNAMVNLVRRKQ